jgi:hypothetical protein
VDRAYQRGILPLSEGAFDHGDYACSKERVPMPGIEGLESNT